MNTTSTTYQLAGSLDLKLLRQKSHGTGIGPLGFQAPQPLEDLLTSLAGGFEELILVDDGGGVGGWDSGTQLVAQGSGIRSFFFLPFLPFFLLLLSECALYSVAVLT